MLRRAEAELTLGGGAGGAGYDGDVADGTSELWCTLVGGSRRQADFVLVWCFVSRYADDDLIDEGDIASDDD